MLTDSFLYVIIIIERKNMKNYFPNATFTGQIYSINNRPWLVREPVQFENFEGEMELGWGANDLSNNCSYHFFTETEVKDMTILEI